ncbi:glycosyltransferase family 4 protein [Paucisalibacillus globulus]|uniref:glycosyltransferase family 4 protein n=1 Tax=Paucisalibacillus globulus TaxID=351095 RepID=UPI0004071E3A|nr:glycosyltransferase family 4 protein [Paucisalibacillus globulus]
MKIYFLVYNIYGMGGTVRTVLNTTNYLAEKGYNIEIISVFRKQKEPFFEINPKVSVTAIHDLYKLKKRKKGLKEKIFNRLMRLKSIFIHRSESAYNQFSIITDLKLLSYIKSLKSGVLVSTRPSLNLFVAKHATNKVVKVGQEHINFESHDEELKRSIIKSYPKLEYLITLTDKDNDNYKEIFKNSKIKIRKITNSVIDLNYEKSQLNQKTILAAGRLDYVKGYDLLINAFSVVAAKHPDWNLKIFGKGAEKKKLEKQIQEKHLYKNVFLMGPTNKLQEEFNKASIFAVSSRMEGFGLVIVEAMQKGVPVVSFDCPHGPSEIINHGEDGLLVNNGDVVRLAESLIKLIEDEKLRRKLGNNAYENASRFSIEQIGREWEDFFNGILK